jgi:hypothetical protein
MRGAALLALALAAALLSLPLLPGASAEGGVAVSAPGPVRAAREPRMRAAVTGRAPCSPRAGAAHPSRRPIKPPAPPAAAVRGSTPGGGPGP